MTRYLLFASELYALAILRPLQRAIRERGDEAAWVVHRKLSRHLAAEETRLDTPAKVAGFDPAAVFVPGNWVPAGFPGIKVEVFHGFNTHKRAERKGHFRIRGFFDLYCTQGPSTTRRFEELAARHGYFRVVETGWPKLDPLFRPGPSPGRAGDGRPVVLYASTFNESLSSTRELFETIRRESATGSWSWIVTLHPKISPDIVERYRGLEGPNLRFAASDDVVSLLAAADVMLCDTSSILHEFLVQEKPVVTFRNRAPGAHIIDVREADEVVPALRRALGRPPDVMRAVSAYANDIHPYRDGRSSERVLDATERFLEAGPAELRRKPLNLVRRVKARRRLADYWAAD